jgi:hypothetical protein
VHGAHRQGQLALFIQGSIGKRPLPRGHDGFRMPLQTLAGTGQLDLVAAANE